MVVETVERPAVMLLVSFMLFLCFFTINKMTVFSNRVWWLWRERFYGIKKVFIFNLKKSLSLSGPFV